MGRAEPEEIVPGMAEAIEQRRVECFDNLDDFAEAAGISLGPLFALRRGKRRDYSAKVRSGVARALNWPPDCISRLMRGDDPSTFMTVHYDAQGRAVSFTAPPSFDVNSELARIREQVERLQARLEEIDPQ